MGSEKEYIYYADPDDEPYPIRRKLNPPGEDCFLLSTNRVVAEIDMIKHCQRVYKTKYWAGAGFRKLSIGNKGAKQA